MNHYSGRKMDTFTFNCKTIKLNNESGETIKNYTDHNIGKLSRVLVKAHDTKLVVQCCDENESLFKLNKNLKCVSLSVDTIYVKSDEYSFIIIFENETNAKECISHIASVCQKTLSVFDKRTEKASEEQYFAFYGFLSQQQNMMQDFIRTSTYQRAILDNSIDFRNKVVMDVGSGSGILSFFAAQNGAKMVYSIEASSQMSKFCQQLVDSNHFTNITVVNSKVEDVKLNIEVDMIISESMGYMLLNERMLESYVHSRKWLKPTGKMFPSQADFFITPFTDEALFMETVNKTHFWSSQFYGIHLKHLLPAAVEEYFKQPIVDTFDIRICMARSMKHTINFLTIEENQFENINIDLNFVVRQAGNVHGLAFWFDVAFMGSVNTVWLSTSPSEPLTHWYQVRCLIPEPLFVKEGDRLVGKLQMLANKKQSYDIYIELEVEETRQKSKNKLDVKLKNPFFRYNIQEPYTPPGTQKTSATDSYWNNVSQNEQYNQNVQNGGTANILTNSDHCNMPNSYEPTNVQNNSISENGKWVNPFVKNGTQSPKFIKDENIFSKTNNNVKMGRCNSKEK
ncbi:hypothetical protein A3Q56_01857 [Intoshia linei]|uniref:type I protein arginine methyltransferase n=1 Tax=Intoshia linei TaxID=1819745 RepID=A0A177B800_9BILA|nr:hypothetical protein A3Q56_01857 [Intoshia linei]